MKIRPCSLANASPSSLFTSRRASRSLKYFKNIKNGHEVNKICFPFFNLNTGGFREESLLLKQQLK